MCKVNDGRRTTRDYNSALEPSAQVHKKLHCNAKIGNLNNFSLKVPKKSLGSEPKIRVGQVTVNTHFFGHY